MPDENLKPAAVSPAIISPAVVPPAVVPPAVSDTFIDRLKKGAIASHQQAAPQTQQTAPQQTPQQTQQQAPQQTYAEQAIQEQMEQVQDQDEMLTQQIRAQEQSEMAYHRPDFDAIICALRGDQPPAPPKPRTIACMITHGMGEQVPFETAAAAASAFVRGRKPTQPPQANRVALVPDGDLVSRMELHYDATATEPETIVHVYEGYWAPLTEGKITYKSIIAFLFQTAGAGIRIKRNNRFDRWIFNALRELPIKSGTNLYLLLTVFVLAFAALFVLFAAYELDHLWTLLKTSAESGFIPFLHSVMLYPRQHPGATALDLLILPAAWIAYQIRWFLIEYVGDVVIYVSSYKVSAYQEVRDAIQKTILDIGTQIVAATDPPTPICGPDAKATHGQPGAPPFVYDGLLFAGHSLGSVITFDLVNALITWDTDGCGGRHDLVNRITRLLTFGSPLDKTAFLFRTQISTEEHHFRELMAGNMQALTLDYALRPFPWINLYSHRDPVSGSLAYYDLPESADPALPDQLPPGASRVQNIQDPAARIPGYAHMQYWTGALLSEHLLAGVGLKPDPAPTPP